MAWALISPDENAIITEIDREFRRKGDRSAALVSGAFVEQRLTGALRAAFVHDKKIENKLFKGYGPLGSFSAKIDMGLMLGLYSAEIHKTLHTVREIRNCFAHTVGPTNFESQRVRDLCHNLALVKQNLFVRPLKAIPDATTGEMDKQTFIKLVMSSIFNHRDTPKNRYIATVKALVMLLLIAEGFAAEWTRGRVLPFAASPDKSVPPPPPHPRNGNRIRKRRKRPPQPSPA